MNNHFKKVRDSNMELLRIVAMFFVVMFHTCDYSVGTPIANDDLAINNSCMC